MARVSHPWGRGTSSSSSEVPGRASSASLQQQQQQQQQHQQPASAAEIDRYAQRVLEQQASLSQSQSSLLPPPDSSLGSYVTNLLRCYHHEKLALVQDIPDFDSLVELVQEHCACPPREATDALQLIAHAVWKQTIPTTAPPTTTTTAATSSPSSWWYPPVSHQHQQSPFAAASLENPQRDPQDNLAPLATTTNAPLSTKPTLLAVSQQQQQQDGSLIPADILGFLDEPSPHKQQQQQNRYQQRPQPRVVAPSALQQQQQATSYKSSSYVPVTTTTNAVGMEEAFPTLAASVSNSSGGKKKGKKSNNTNSNNNNSASKLSTSPKPISPYLGPAATGGGSDSSSPIPMTMGGPVVPPYSGTTVVASSSSSSSLSYNNNHNNSNTVDAYGLAFGSAVEILLSMNPDLSEAAATEAVRMAPHADVNIAQYILEKAWSAPPVCRHLLQSGCYRSDCQFSHDIDGHTCMFWLRGRCGKGNHCRFRHGFAPRVLQELQQYYHPNNSSSSSTTTATAATATTSYAPAVAYPSSQVPATTHPATDWGQGTTSRSRSGMKTSFANVASKDVPVTGFFNNNDPSSSQPSSSSPLVRPKKVDIPLDLWHAHENRDASAFYIADPLERFRVVSTTVRRADCIDLHFQSTKTFPAVLSTVLPAKLETMAQVWIITGTGHHVGTRTHQRGGGALESAVMSWLTDEGYSFAKGRDRNGLGGAVLVYRTE